MHYRGRLTFQHIAEVATIDASWESNLQRAFCNLKKAVGHSLDFSRPEALGWMEIWTYTDALALVEAKFRAKQPDKTI